MCFVNTGNSSPNISQFAENNKGTLAASSIACFLLTAKIAARPAGDNVGCQCFCKPVMCSRCVHVMGDAPYWCFHNVSSSSCHIACLLTGGRWRRWRWSCRRWRQLETDIFKHHTAGCIQGDARTTTTCVCGYFWWEGNILHLLYLWLGFVWDQAQTATELVGETLRFGLK